VYQWKRNSYAHRLILVENMKVAHSVLNSYTVALVVCYQGYSNAKEAAEVIKCALAVVTKYPAETTVKIITFYNKQRAKLNDLLAESRASISSSDALNYIDVCSIDACQVRHAQF
jgi:AAA domain